MINVKSIGIFAGCGFVLSFLIGLISGNAFLPTVLRALLFAFCFAVLAAGISFIYSNFLSDGTSTSSTESAVPAEKKAGSKVDIVISDDNLDGDDNGPSFNVENNRQGLSNTPPREEKKDVEPVEKPVSQPEEKIQNSPSPNEDVVEEVSPVEQTQSAPAFVPGGFENAEKVSAEKVVNNNVMQEVPANNGDSDNKTNNFADGSNISDIDELPDIQDLSADKKDEEIGGIISDSDFATNGSKSSGGSSFPDGSEPSIQNADVMAQAIRTLLAKE